MNNETRHKCIFCNSSFCGCHQDNRYRYPFYKNTKSSFFKIQMFRDLWNYKKQDYKKSDVDGKS